MGDLSEATAFVLPAYAVTFITFGALWFFVFRRLRKWANAAKDEGGDDHP
jgi:hypothetical protein